MSRFVNRLPFGLGTRQEDSIVPPAALTSHLTLFSAAAMAFLAVFALTFAFSAGRVADRWSSDLVRTGTIRLSAPEGQIEIQTRAVLEALKTTSGIASARVIPREEQADLLEPWLGEDLPLSVLPLPRLIEMTETPAGPDEAGLRLRLKAEAPGAVWDNHARWRAPIVESAQAVRRVAIGSAVLILACVGAMVTLAARAALSANADVIKTLRLIGAEDRFITSAFVRRSTGRAVIGALIGTGAAVLILAILPASASSQSALLSSFGLHGLEWIAPLAIPVLIGIVAFAATRFAAHAVVSRFG